MDESEIGAEFPLREGLIHLNHAAVSPWPRRTRDAICAFADENMRQSAENFPEWDAHFGAVRAQAAQLLNTESEHLALVKNTSEALSMVAWGLDWQGGENVVSLREEFASMRMVWESLSRIQVESRQMVPGSEESVEDCLERGCDANTRLMAVSSVQYASGRRLDLHRLSHFCRQQGILFLVDAIQSLGALAHDLKDCPVDFLAAGSHKWLMSPEGVGLLYCHPAHRNQLTQYEFGWGMVSDPFAFSALNWTPDPGGRRFECGSPNRLGIHALGASLSLLLEIGPREVERRVLSRADHLAQLLRDCKGLEPVFDPASGPASGIVSYQLDDLTPEQVVEALDPQGVVCASRGGYLRFSPHFYTPLALLDEAAQKIHTTVALLRRAQGSQYD